MTFLKPLFVLSILIPFNSLAIQKNELRLAGTIVHSETKKSIASINQKAYQREEWISPHYVLLEVRRFKVRLQDMKSKEFFWLKTSPFDSSRTIPQKGLFKSKSKTFHIKRDRIDKVTANLPDFLNDAGTRPVKNKNGELKGFELTFIKRGGAFDGLGLKKSDTLTEVNGMKLDSVDAVLKIYQQLRESSIIELNIERTGRLKKVTYEIKP